MVEQTRFELASTNAKLLLLVHSSFKCSASFESGNSRCCDLQRFTSARILTCTSGTLVCFKSAKTNQLNVFFLGNCLGDDVHQCIDSTTSSSFAQFSFFCQCFDEF